MTAKHKRGFRRYNFDRVEWALAEGGLSREVQLEPMLELELKDTKGGHRTSFYFGGFSYDWLVR